jgi:hypothetical protein
VLTSYKLPRKGAVDLTSWGGTFVEQRSLRRNTAKTRRFLARKKAALPREKEGSASSLMSLSRERQAARLLR